MTDFLKVKNRAISTLASGIADDDLALTVATGEGVKFPTIFPFHIVIEKAAGVDFEVLKCTNRVVDVLTVVRGQDNTLASAHLADEVVELRVTAGIVTELQSFANAIPTGNVTTGVFPVARGGTGLSTIALGGILYASALDTLLRLAPTASSQILRSTAANALQFAALIAADIPTLDAAKIASGIFPIVRGGTGLSAIAAGGILYASSVDTLARIAPSASNQVLRSTAANALQFAALLAADIPNLDTSKITTGAFATTRIPNLDTSKTTTGQFSISRLTRAASGFLKALGAGVDPAYTALAASDIASGTFDLARIPTTLTGKDADTVDTYHAAALEKVANKAAANGYCDLDASVLVPLTRIPTTLTGKDADTVDGVHAGNAANKMPVLDASALLPLAQIPSTLTGKDADTVDGTHAGNTANRVPILDGAALLPLAQIPATLTSKDADTVDAQHRVLTINADHTHQSAGAQGGTLDAAAIASSRFGMPRMPAGTSGQVLTAQGAGVDPAYGSFPSHGATEHSNVTREKFISAGEGVCAAGVHSADITFWATIKGLANAYEPVVNFTMKVPDDFVSFISVKAIWESSAASGNMYWRICAYYATGGESYTTHIDFPDFGTTATGGASKVNVQTPTDPLTLSGLTKGDYLGLEFDRQGAFAQDTLEADMYLFGLLFTYTAEQ